MMAEDELPSTERAAWGNYWQTSGSTRCVPDTPGIVSRTSGLWQDLARRMPRGGRLLDLGSGVGAVLEEVAKARPDLKLIGVDFVEAVPKAKRKFEIKVPVRMEELPFPASRFDSVLSQFGFEYSDMERSTEETARVLRPRGIVQFLIHHRSGAIVSQGRRRREALHWALFESGSFEIAHRVITTRKMLPMPTPSRLRDEVERARLTFPHETVAVQILGALLQTIVEGEQEGPAATERRVAWLQDHARYELIMLDALSRVAQDEKGIHAIAEQLGAQQLRMDPPELVTDPQSGLAFAWLVRGTKLS